MSGNRKEITSGELVMLVFWVAIWVWVVSIGNSISADVKRIADAVEKQGKE